MNALRAGGGGLLPWGLPTGSPLVWQVVFSLGGPSTGSNLRPLDLETSALPTELWGHTKT
jgi:hypothetical protein